MDNNQKYKLFTASGCLSEEGLELFTRGLLPDEDAAMVNSHLQSCELCTSAAEGYVIADPAFFSEDVEALNLRFENSDQRYDVIAEEPASIKPLIPFWKRIRVEFAAAALLLLMAIGGWQIYVSRMNSRNSGELATVTVTPDSTEKISVLHEAVGAKSGRVDPVAEQIPSGAPDRKQKVIQPEIVENLSVVEDDSGLLIGDSAEKDMIAGVQNEITTDADTLKTIEPSTKSDILAAAGTAKAKRSESLSWTQNEEEVAEAEIFTVVEESPQFPGGHDARLKFLEENIHYPDEARNSLVQGTVYISFVVEKDGSITDIRVLRGIGAGCDEEAVRVIKLMPRWKPGKQRGKPVRVHFNLPIKFSLAG